MSFSASGGPQRLPLIIIKETMTEKQREYYRKYYDKNRDKLLEQKRKAYKPHRNTHGYFSRKSMEAAYEQRINDNRARIAKS